MSPQPRSTPGPGPEARLASGKLSPLWPLSQDASVPVPIQPLLCLPPLLFLELGWNLNFSMTPLWGDVQDRPLETSTLRHQLPVPRSRQPWGFQAPVWPRLRAQRGLLLLPHPWGSQGPFKTQWLLRAVSRSPQPTARHPALGRVRPSPAASVSRRPGTVSFMCVPLVPSRRLDQSQEPD